ncbi:hypothetical protein DSO57_1031556 [Entomophthora muscae]|uniref:Uncharacterized protein n=1 Tax=Entomophthora muscae TaxID=34485 RepID=A0ACC2SPR8_9FUNG|nr:hypothetical protein DSO57_1031556 [Entomophthora muscae]
MRNKFGINMLISTPGGLSAVGMSSSQDKGSILDLITWGASRERGTTSGPGVAFDSPGYLMHIFNVFLERKLVMVSKVNSDEGGQLGPIKVAAYDVRKRLGAPVARENSMGSLYNKRLAAQAKWELATWGFNKDDVKHKSSWMAEREPLKLKDAKAE